MSKVKHFIKATGAINWGILFIYGGGSVMENLKNLRDAIYKNVLGKPGKQFYLQV